MAPFHDTIHTLTEAASKEVIDALDNSHADHTIIATGLASHPNKQVRGHLARSAHLGAFPEAQKILAADEDHFWVRSGLSANPAISPEAQDALADEAIWAAYFAQYKRGYTDHYYMNSCDGHEGRIFYFLAQNPALAPAIQLRLAGLNNRYLDHALAARDNLAPETQAALAGKEGYQYHALAEALAKNPGLEIEILDALAHHERAQVRKEIANNANLGRSPQTIAALLTDTDEYVRRRVLARRAELEAAPGVAAVFAADDERMSGMIVGLAEAGIHVTQA